MTAALCKAHDKMRHDYFRGLLGLDPSKARDEASGWVLLHNVTWLSHAETRGLSVFTAPIHRYTATGASTVRFMFEKAKIISDQKHCRNTAAAHIAAAREATSRAQLPP